MSILRNLRYNVVLDWNTILWRGMICNVSLYIITLDEIKKTHSHIAILL